MDAWEAYLYPGTNTLINKLGIWSEEKLFVDEIKHTRRRAMEIDTTDVIPRTYDDRHLQAIHYHLFQDVYDWAGQYRLVGIGKGNSEFAGLETIPLYLESATLTIHNTDWANVDRKEFVTVISAVFADLNTAHPFREGNGRTTRLFLKHVSEKSRFHLSLAAIDRDAWLQGSALSMPIPGTFRPRFEHARPMFEQITTPCTPQELADRARNQTRRTTTDRARAANPPQHSPNEPPERRTDPGRYR